jgi:hypothetical protein
MTLLVIALCLAVPSIIRITISAVVILIAVICSARAAGRPREPAWAGRVRQLPPLAVQIATTNSMGFHAIEWVDADENGADVRLPRLRRQSEPLLNPLPAPTAHRRQGRKPAVTGGEPIPYQVSSTPQSAPGSF